MNLKRKERRCGVVARRTVICEEMRRWALSFTRNGHATDLRVEEARRKLFKELLGARVVASEMWDDVGHQVRYQSRIALVRREETIA